jgi:hypothetical protein
VPAGDSAYGIFSVLQSKLSAVAALTGAREALISSGLGGGRDVISCKSELAEHARLPPHREHARRCGSSVRVAAKVAVRIQVLGI